MSEAAGTWERLPEDTAETCDWATDRDGRWGLGIGHHWGWQRPGPGNNDRCGSKAAFIQRETCGCGACDMTKRHCENHQREWLEEKRRRAEAAAQTRVERIEELPPGIVGFRRKEAPR